MRLISIMLAFLLLWATLLSANDDKKTDVAEPLSWDLLKDVKTIEKDLMLVPQFGSDLEALDGTEITLKGYMMPLDQAQTQKNFILSANPVAGCYFCMPGGPETMVEVKAGKAVKFGYNPIKIRGTLELLRDDPMGMFYRLTDARLVE